MIQEETLWSATPGPGGELTLLQRLPPGTRGGRVLFVLAMSRLARTALSLSVVIGVVTYGSASALAARPATGSTAKELSAAAAKWSTTDSLALDRAGNLIEDTGYRTQPFVRRTLWISSLDPQWARVLVWTTRNDRISTILKEIGGRWRTVASGGFGGADGNRRDAAQCRRTGIPPLVAADLALGSAYGYDPARRCQGPQGQFRRLMSAGERQGVRELATSDKWPGFHDDTGECVDRYPGQGTAARGSVARTQKAWSVLYVYCTQGSVGNQGQIGMFAAVFHSGRPVERLNVSPIFGTRCFSGRALASMPLVARLELGVCTLPRGLYDAAN